MERDALTQAANRPFAAVVTLEAEEAVFHGAAIPLPGKAVVNVGTSGLDATIVDETGWHNRPWQTFPPGTMGDPAIVFRPTVPNQLIHERYYGRIETNAGWKAEDVLYAGHGMHWSEGVNRDTYRFRVHTLRRDGPAVGKPVVGLRAIYRSAGFNVADRVDDGIVASR